MLLIEESDEKLKFDTVILLQPIFQTEEGQF